MNQDNKNNEAIAEISYCLLKDDSIKLNIEVEDYSEESVDALARICSSIASEEIIYETISHIRDKLVEDNNTVMLVFFVSQLNNYSQLLKKLEKAPDNNQEEPCIKPSDML